MKPIKKSSFSEAVIYTQILDAKTLLAVDALTTVRYLDIETLKLLDELKVDVSHTRYGSKVVSFSGDAKYFALIDKEYKTSMLYETKGKKLLTKVDRHQGDVSCVAIEPHGRYMFSCGDEGITYGIDINSAQLTFTLPPHKDFVTDIAFTQDGKWVATSGYDKNISLYNLAMMTPHGKLKAHSAPVLKVQFLEDGRLFSLDKKSTAIVWNVNSANVIARLKGIHDEVLSVCVGSKNRFLFLGTKLGYVLVYDLLTYEQISKKYIKLSDAITSLSFDEAREELIVGSANGELLVYDIFDKEKHLRELLEQKKYSHISGCIRENPLLAYTKPHRTFEILWEKTLQRAKLLLENSEKVKAEEIFKDFMLIASKKQQMQKLLSEYSEYEKFLSYVKSKKLSLAYALVNLHPLYKETKVYKSMEAQWERDLVLAKKYMLDQKLSHKVQEILLPYRGISEKSALIQELIQNVNLYKRFREAITHRKFKLALEIVKQAEFLKEYPEYKALINYSDNLYMKAQVMLGNGDTNSALQIFHILLDFDDFRDEAKESIALIEAKRKFFGAIKEENSALAYTIMDEFETLKESQDGKLLNAQWEEDLKKADDLALYANIEGTKGILAKYMKIKSKTQEIADVFSKAHITQLYKALDENMEQKKVENGIKNYMLYYGLTKRIEGFFEDFKVKFPHTKININSQKQGLIESWRPSMIVNSIL
ncbi:hypothetical protein FCU45_04950 [Sulfurimonas crateris]|uniref:LRRK2 beta-propeller domain-containing protein n=1 Tax=Sulfurimonas crateris TaxID=2574727 RepID=A0A4V5TM10_9BACT|nr:hypothetical protein [Sulfurimonas crateris]TKI69963.1 hypothetical protein FCU45_04950 [Sulfurimonas crateris]